MVDRRVPGSNVTFVTPSEVKAAQMKVRRMLERGEQPSSALIAIARAAGDFDVEPPRPQTA
jgi:hypothetical protein